MTSAEEMLQSGTDFIKSNIGAVASGAGGLVVGSAIGLAAGVAVASKTKRKRRKSARNPKRSRRNPYKRTRKRTRRTPRTAGKGKDRSTKRIRYTKKGQPYVIMASGKARFIKKKGAKASHKRKGGRY